MPAPLVVGAAAAAARALARKLAKDSAKKAVKKAVKTAKKSKPLAQPKSAVKVKYNKQAMEKSILKSRMPKGESEGAKRARDIESRMKSSRVKIKTQENLNSNNPKKALKEFKEDRVKQLGEWATHPGGASFKSNQRLVKKGKWSSPEQVARYQKQEVKQGIKDNARGLKAANKPKPKKSK